MAKIGRNDPCWCGSGRKYKKCHLGTPADNQRNNLESLYGEFGARSMVQSLENINKEKKTGITTGKTNIKELIAKIMEDKKAGNRQKPSNKLILGKSKFKSDLRRKLVDIVADIVDQNWCGRSEMCVLFAILLSDALNMIKVKAQAVIGKSTYKSSDPKKDEFTWDHAWVLVENEIIDGNVDSMIENPAVPGDIHPDNYWGAIDTLPKDRKLIKDKVIDENWIVNNTTYDELTRWRFQLKEKIKYIKID